MPVHQGGHAQRRYIPGKKFLGCPSTPMFASYRPKIDTTPELESSTTNHYQSLIGALRWIVELGQVDVYLEVSIVSSDLTLSRLGHDDALYHVFAYQKREHNSELVFDPVDPVIDPADPVIAESSFHRKGWTSSEFWHAWKQMVRITNPPIQGCSRG